MQARDLAGVQHWDSTYQKPISSIRPGWKPKNYTELALKHMFLGEIKRANPKSILEVGCGNSTWLPYLAKCTGARVAGIDYSEDGCRLARERLKLENVVGDVHCLDIFASNATSIGQFDFVYSLGVIEHFSDLNAVLTSLLRFVKPGGYLLSEVPNLRSMHGVLSWIWQPRLLAMHLPVSKNDLVRSYETQHLQEVRAYYLGFFSLSIVNWKKYPRWPRLASRILPWIEGFVYYTDRFFLRQVPVFCGIAPFAPFIYAIGRKPATE